jgi:hypothetical protein
VVNHSRVSVSGCGECSWSKKSSASSLPEAVVLEAAEASASTAVDWRLVRRRRGLPAAATARATRPAAEEEVTKTGRERAMTGFDSGDTDIEQGYRVLANGSLIRLFAIVQN